MTEGCILQVEDDAQAVFLQQQAFRRVRIGNGVQVVTDGQDAIDYLAGKRVFSDRRKYPLPFLVLLKLKLPRLPGLEVLQWIRSQPSLKALVVIVLSLPEHASDVERAYELGANSCVLQPSDLEAWLGMARSFKAWWLVHNQFVCAQPVEWRRAGADRRASA